MVRATIDSLHHRMNKEIENLITKHISRDLIYAALKKQQISYRYLQLMQAAMRKRRSFHGFS